MLSQNPPIQDQVQKDVQDKKPEVLHEVIVTASKVKQRIEDIPGSVGIIKRKTIVNSKANSLDEILGRIPGVITQNRFGSDNVRIAIRGAGIRTNFGVRNIIVLIDGIPITAELTAIE